MIHSIIQPSNKTRHPDLLPPPARYVPTVYKELFSSQGTQYETLGQASGILSPNRNSDNTSKNVFGEKDKLTKIDLKTIELKKMESIDDIN